MNCRSVRKHISDYLDDKLPANLMSDFQEHVLNCSKCASEISEMRSTIAGLRSLAVQRCPANLWPEVRSAIQSMGAPSTVSVGFPRRFLIAPAVAVAIAVLLALPVRKSEIGSPRQLAFSEYRHYLIEHMRVQKQPFVDSDVIFAATELDTAPIMIDGD